MRYAESRFQMLNWKYLCDFLPTGDFMYPSNQSYESGKQLKLTKEADETTYYDGCDGKPLHRMEMTGANHTRLVVQNIHSNEFNVIPSTESEDEIKPKL
jgi:hypothetical protein